MNSIEDTKIVLETLRSDFKTCRTEREALDDAIYYLEVLETYLEDEDE